MCSCVHAHVILYMSVLEARISAIMRMGNFDTYIELSYGENLTTGEKWLYQEGLFHNIVFLIIGRERGAYSLTTSVSFNWAVADDMFICFIQSHS